jgi:hypothetical protein
MSAKEDLLAEFEKVKLEVHQAVDAVVADEPEYVAQLAKLADSHGLLQALAKVLPRL